MQRAKRFRDEDDLDYNESVRKAYRKRRHLIEIKLKQNKEPNLFSNEEDDENEEDEELPKERKERHDVLIKKSDPDRFFCVFALVFKYTCVCNIVFVIVCGLLKI